MTAEPRDMETGDLIVELMDAKLRPEIPGNDWRDNRERQWWVDYIERLTQEINRRISKPEW